MFIGDSDGSPAGIWSARLCVRSGSEGGGIFKGSLGSMLPYVMKAKDDKLGIVLFDDVFKDSMRDGEIDVRVGCVWWTQDVVSLMLCDMVDWFWNADEECNTAIYDGLAQPRADLPSYACVRCSVPGWWQSLC